MFREGLVDMKVSGFLKSKITVARQPWILTKFLSKYKKSCLNLIH